MPYWPGGIPFEKNRLVDYDQGYRFHEFHMGENTGTHVDAPSHFIEGGHMIHDIPAEDLLVPAVVINVQDKVETDPNYLLTEEDVLSWEKEHEKIKPGTLVIMNTVWYKRFDSVTNYQNMDSEALNMHFLGYSAESAELLLERDVVGIGIDTLSLDFGESRDFPVHRIMLVEGKYMIENLNNLDELPPTGAWVVVGVLPVRDGTEAQARILGLKK